MKLKQTVYHYLSWSFQVLTISFLLSSCTTDDVTPETVDVDKPLKAVFDFTSSAAVTGWGINIPGGSAGTEISTITQDGIKITASHGESSTHARIYATGSGVLDLRVYAGDKLTFTAMEGYVITSMEWTSQNTATMNDWTPNCGTITNGTWLAPVEGKVNSVTFTATGTTRMNVLTVTYEKGTATYVPEEEPTGPEPTGPVTLSLDFTSATSITGWGYEVPGASAGIPMTGALVIDNFTLTPINAADATDATSVRFYTSKGGVTDLRIYKDDALKLSVKEGRVITAVSWTSANAETIDAWTTESGSISGGVWTGEAGKTYNNITITATGTTRMNVLTVTYE